MDAISYAVSEVRYRIPPQVLSIVFGPTGNVFVHNAEAVEAAIRDKIIEGRVRQVADTSGAMMVEIPLDGLSPQRLEFQEINRFSYVFRIPKTLTNGRRITSALALAYGNNSQLGIGYQAQHQSYYGSGCGHSPMVDAANGLMAANSPIPIVQSALLTIIGENVVMVEDYVPLARSLFLRCIVGNDQEFTNVKPQSYPAFAELVTLATKAYIYNNYYINLGKGYLVGGQELPEIREIISEYRDADELFLTYVREKWNRIAQMNDSRRFQRRLLLLSSGNI